MIQCCLASSSDVSQDCHVFIIRVKWVSQGTGTTVVFLWNVVRYLLTILYAVLSDKTRILDVEMPDCAWCIILATSLDFVDVMSWTWAIGYSWLVLPKSAHSGRTVKPTRAVLAEVRKHQRSHAECEIQMCYCDIQMCYWDIQICYCDIQMCYCDIQMLFWYTDVLLWHTDVLLWHTDVLLWHTAVLLWHTDVLLWHTDVLLFLHVNQVPNPCR